jgi:hypothetical protein
MVMNDYKQYRSWLTGLNSTGEQPQFDATSDARVKKFVTDAYSSDPILRKMIGLKFLADNVIDDSLAQIWFLKQML